MDLLKLAKQYENEIVKEIQSLVQIPSVLEETNLPDAPFGEGIRDSLRYTLELGKKLGFDTLNVDDLAGHIEFGQGEEILGILCHVDVVPADGEWNMQKFGGEIVEGKIYGRGTSDDKGPTICGLYAMKLLKDLGFVPNKKVRLIIGTDEETAWRGISHYLAKQPKPHLGFSPDADFPLIYGEKGIMSLDLVCENNDANLKSFVAGSRYNVVAPIAPAEFTKDIDTKLEKENNKYTAYGKSAHAMEPDNGINAAVLLAKELYQHTTNNLVRFICDGLTNSRMKDLGLDKSIEPMGPLTMNLGIVRIDEATSRAGLNFRYPHGFDSEKFIQQLQEKCLPYNITVEVKENKGPHFVDPKQPIVQELHKAYIEITGDDKTPIKTIGGGTYARALDNAVAYGALFPGERELAHEPDEYISIESAIKATAIIANAIYKLTK